MLCCSFFKTISSKCPSKRDEDSTSYSYISDSSVLSLHKLLWDHQEKIGTYLATKRLGMIRIFVDLYFTVHLAIPWLLANKESDVEGKRKVKSHICHRQPTQLEPNLVPVAWCNKEYCYSGMLVHRRIAPAFCRCIHLYTWVERERERVCGEVSCPRKQHDDRDQAFNHRNSDLKFNPLTTTPGLHDVGNLTLYFRKYDIIRYLEIFISL